MANRDPMSGVATIAINARGTPTKGLRKDPTTKNTNAHKPRTESSAVFVTWSHLAPSARAGSERPAAATIMRISRPTQKIGEGHDADIHGSAWKGNSPKFTCRILHRTPSQRRK